MDDEIRDGWASASVRLDAPDVAGLPLPTELLQSADLGRNPRIMLLPIDNPDRVRMEQLLIRLTIFLRQHERSLTALQGVEIDIVLGWSPKSPQESLQIDTDLIAVLARLNAPIIIDTYSE